ncbi:hypothetical protein [Spiroplasma endosymbiont of Zeiraphera isertana]|uniref:hypothetical protein n=1 Tax=Spiroplasma endosymbiont of Zeiraphera isertana TaxID=3066313 RepID=UPI00313B0C4D
MNNYLLSVDPSIKNTGFTLWDIKWCRGGCGKEIYHHHTPIWIKSFNFQKQYDFYLEVKSKVHDLIEITRKISKFNIVIERGTFHSKNGIGYETQEHLRGFIAGQFNKLITKDMLISQSKLKSWYKENYKNITIDYSNWKKEYSLILVKDLITFNNWNITVNNHDEADSLLIGWYYLNKE